MMGGLNFMCMVASTRVTLSVGLAMLTSGAAVLICRVTCVDIFWAG